MFSFLVGAKHPAVFYLLTWHVESQLTLPVFTHSQPPKHPWAHLLEVDNVVACRAVALPVKPEVVAAQSCNSNKNTSQLNFGGSHFNANSSASSALFHYFSFIFVK